MADLLNYLEMVESGQIIEKRLEKNLLRKQKEKTKIYALAKDEKYEERK